jgi:hypothetical protein
MEQFKAVEVDAITPLMDYMHRILFKVETLTHSDRKTLQDLIVLLEQRVREGSFDADADGGA